MPFRPLCILPLFALTALPLPAEDAAALWHGKVQPLFDRHCVKCHGPLEDKGGLELDTAAAVQKGGDEGAVVVPGKPEESRLVTALAAGSDPHMPPKKQLSDSEIAVVRDWVAALGLPPAPPPPPEDPLPPDATAAIDEAMARAALKAGIKPAPVCDDATFVRRIYLDLAGRIPDASERQAFLDDPAPDRRAKLVDRLLGGNEYARHMREVWDVLLMGRGRRNAWERRQKNHWHEWLEESFRQNRPWPGMLRALIRARPDRPEDEGSQWFLYERNGDHQRMAEAVAPLIYGTRIDCAQCHDHPLSREILQGHYWGLVAAFNRSTNQKDPAAVQESAIGGFVNFTNLKKESQPAVITLLSGKTLEEVWPEAGAKEDDSPEKYADPAAKVRVPKYSRRAALAEAATRDNPLLAKALVNRVWVQFFGRGLVHPFDEMNSRNPAAHPALLAHLAAGFERSGGDIRSLIRTIVLSGAWQRSSWSAVGAAPDPALFAWAAERPLTGEQIARSWRVAQGVPADDAPFIRAVAEKFPEVLNDAPRADFSQAGFLDNAPEFTALLQPAPGTLTQRMIHLPDNTARVHAAFLAALGRAPSEAELRECCAFLESRPDRPQDACRDLVWALLSSAEFFVH